MYGPTLKARAKLISRDFDGNLNPECLEKRETKNREHDLYFDTRSKTFFVHDFTPGVPAEKSVPAVKRKYARRARRFLENIGNAKHALLIYFSILEEAPETTREEALEAKQILDEKFGTEKIDLWVITHTHIPKDRIAEDTLPNGVRFFYGDIRREPPRDDMDVLMGKKNFASRFFDKRDCPFSPK